MYKRHNFAEGVCKGCGKPQHLTDESPVISVEACLTEDLSAEQLASCLVE